MLNGSFPTFLKLMHHHQKFAWAFEAIPKFPFTSHANKNIELITFLSDKLLSANIFIFYRAHFFPEVFANPFQIVSRQTFIYFF